MFVFVFVVGRAVLDDAYGGVTGAVSVIMLFTGGTRMTDWMDVV